MSPIILKREPDYSIKHDPFPYQENAFKAVRDLEYSALFLEQGLGKTKVAIDLSLYWLEKKTVDTIMVIVKKGLIENWLREFQTHTHIEPKLLTQKRKDNFYVFNSPVKVIITNYEVVRSEEKRLHLFLKTRNVGAILDESVKIKNPNSTITKAFFNIATLLKKRVILTGTPIANRPNDIWAQIFFLDQGKSLGGDYNSFRKDLELSNKLIDDKDKRYKYEIGLQALFTKISSFSVRERKDSGVISLPNKIFKKIITQWETIQFELYKTIQTEERAIVLKNGIPTEDQSEEYLKRLLRLLQVSSNPLLVDENYSNTPGKFDYLYDLVTTIMDKNEKCIIWTSFTDNVNWLKNELREFGACKVHGKMNIERRTKSIDDFLYNPKCRIFIATPGAAKEGLTLTVANHVIFYDRGFSLDDYLQAQDRIHRISQTKECHIYNFVMENSIDEWVDRLLKSKELSALLGQGDISLEYYQSSIDYSFGEMIKEILQLERTIS